MQRSERSGEILRGIEQRTRDVLLRVALAASPRRASRAPQPALADAPQQVLFIREGPLGDLIVSLPAIRAIADSHPETRVDVVATEGNADILRGLSYVRRAITCPRGDRGLASAAAAVRGLAPYDVVVDGMLVHRHVRTRSIAFMAASRAPIWIGESGRRGDWAYTRPVPPPPAELTHLERQLRLAAPFHPAGARAARRTWLSVEPDARRWSGELWASRGWAGRRILVNLSAGHPARRWPDDRFAALLAHIRRRDPAAVIVVVGLPVDAASIAALARQSRSIGHVPDLAQLTALVATAELVVSPDTAVCHLASAFATPLVSLHPLGKEEWWPFATPGRRVVGSEREHLRSIDAGAVIEAVDGMLGERLSVVPGEREAANAARLEHR